MNALLCFFMLLLHVLLFLLTLFIFTLICRNNCSTELHVMFYVIQVQVHVYNVCDVFKNKIPWVDFQWLYCLKRLKHIYHELIDNNFEKCLELFTFVVGSYDDHATWTFCIIIGVWFYSIGFLITGRFMQHLTFGICKKNGSCELIEPHKNTLAAQFCFRKAK